MPEAFSALLVGGPKNGEVVKIPESRFGMPIFVAEIDTRATYRLEEDDDIPVDTITKSLYEMSRVRMFRHVFPVWTHQSLKTEEERQDGLLRLVMNQQGLDLLSEYG